MNELQDGFNEEHQDQNPTSTKTRLESRDLTTSGGAALERLRQRARHAQAQAKVIKL